MYQIKITQKAKKQLKNIRIIYQEEIDTAFETIKEDPYIGKPLIQELKGKFSFRVGVHRIIYTINKSANTVVILKAEHRSIVYKF